MSERWPGGVVNKTAPTSSGGGVGDTATGVWTIDQAAPYIANQTWPGTGTPDPQFQYVTALLHGDGTNAANNNTFLDSSSNNFTITRNGNTTQGSFSPYGNLWSNKYNGSSDYFTVSAGSSFAFGTGDFTVEAWLYPTSTPAQDYIIDARNGGQLSTWSFNFAYGGTSGELDWGSSGAIIAAAPSTGMVKPGVWNHVAYTRSGTSGSLYINGVRVTAVTDTTNYSTAPTTSYIGARFSTDSPYFFNGYMMTRVVKGTALYTGASYTIPTSFTAVTNTVLLVGTSNRFIDASSNNYTLTVGGSPSVQRFSPFQSLATYQTSKIGGSAYFDGSGDYLVTPSNSAFNFSSTDCTIEFWYYGSASGGLAFEWGTGGSGDMQIEMSGGSMTFGPSGGASKTFYALKTNSWNHLAAVKSGSTYYLYINGTRNTTSSGTAASSSNYVNIGCRSGGSVPITGYLSNINISNTALYTGTTLTVPTAPVGTTANTVLSLNFTNGAIYDNAAINNLETVGSAQISTSVYKYGTGSLAFSASGSRLQSDANLGNSVAFGSGNFTIECWVFLTSSSVDSVIMDTRPGTNSGNYFLFYLWTNGGSQKPVVAWYVPGGYALNTGGSVPLNTWTHIAVSRVGSTIISFINGNIQQTASNSTAYANPGAPYPYIGDGYPGGNVFQGYIDDLRVTKGYARYWFNFQPPTAAYPNYGGTVALLTYDPYFSNTTLLLNGEGTNGAQNNTFLDSSSNNFTITRNGNATQGSFSPYGSLWSNYFSSGGTDYFYTGSSGSITFAGDFTWETWIYPTSFPANKVIIASNGLDWGINSSGYMYCYNSGFLGSGSSSPLVANTWQHIALVRSGSTVTYYINGVASGTFSNSTNFNSGNTIYVGSNPGDSATRIPAYLSSLRIVKGTAVYTSNFTPSTSPLTAITNTLFLTCQSNNFVDNSSNAFAITTSGSPSVQRFSPFNPTSTYSTSVIGGSGYFDGSGDDLTLTLTGGLGSGDFTVEYWIYPTSLYNYISVLSTSRSSTGFNCGTQAAGQIVFYSSAGGEILRGSTAMKPNTWNHCAYTRSGSTMRGYLNGVLDATGTASNNFSQTSAAIGSLDHGSEFLTGYVSDLRVVTGTALYTGSTLTIPSAPLSTVSGTQLLTNFTNAGIPDLAMQNDLETVGSAQVSTAQYKYGSSSLSFDGTGDYMVGGAFSSPAHTIGSGDFTVEGWFYTNTNKTQIILDTGTTSGSTTGLQVALNSSGYPYFVISNSVVLTSSIAVPTTTWTHVAWVRVSGTIMIFVNGNQAGTASNTTNISDTGLTIGTPNDYRDTSSTYHYNGYIDDLRITKGQARYAQNFTPPTAALPTY